MAHRTESIPLHKVAIGHIMHHDGQFKIVDGLSAGYPTLDDEWSLRVTFTDATTIFIPYPSADTTTEVVTSFY